MYSVHNILSTLMLAQATPPAEVAPTGEKQPEQVGDLVKNVAHEGSRLLAEYGMRVVGALIFLIGAWIVSAYIVRAIVRGLTKAHVDITLAKFTANLARWSLLVLVVIACLGIFGVPATSFVTVLGTVGLAIGLAVQGSLSHLAAGVMLMVFRPFRVGDAVVVAGQQGVVDEIELFSTRLDTPDNRRVIIPNGQVFGAIIVNVTHNEVRKVEVPIGIGYAADINQTRQVLLNAAASVPNLAEGKSVDVNIAAFSASSVDWMVSVWAKGADMGGVKQALMQRIKEALEEAGIDIPYPQLVVHAPGLARKPEMAGT